MNDEPKHYLCNNSQLQLIHNINAQKINRRLQTNKCKVIKVFFFGLIQLSGFVFKFCTVPNSNG